MRDYQGYKFVTHGDLPLNKLKKVIKGGKLTFTKEELQGNSRKTLFHPLVAKMLQMAKSKNKGANSIPVALGEMMADMQYHDNMGGSMYGGSIWKSIWSGLKSLWNPVIKPALSTIADMTVTPIQGALSKTPLAPLAAAVPALRSGLREISGIGMTTQQKRLKALERARNAKKNKINVMTGSSFRIN